jgi:PTH1 family peptidyl-tRNA hydrolase
MILIVGLGNPGLEYTHTRHNVGFMAVTAIASNLCTNFASNSKFKGNIASSTLSGEKILLLKPDTYMNLSGAAVQLVCSYYKINAAQVIVIHDDIDLALGDIRIKCGGGHAGHNGLKSIDSHIGKNYFRVRIGVGRPSHSEDVAHYVLENFSKTEKVAIEEMIESIPNVVRDLIIPKNVDAGTRR